MDSRARRAAVALLTAATVLVPLAGAASAAPTTGRPWRTPQHLTPVTAGVPPKFDPPVDVAKQLAANAPAIAAPAWPTAATAVVSLTAPAGSRGLVAGEPLVGSTVVGGLAVNLATTPATAEAATANAGIRVESLSRGDAAKAGRDGLVLRLSRVDTKEAAGKVTVSVDYSSVATAFGGDWARRMRLEALPECALTTPAATGCQATPMPSQNDVAGRQVSATVAVPSGGGAVMLATTGGTSSAGGDYSATSLTPSATWSAGGSTGDFNWSYPLRVPPAMNGPVPSIALGYSSQSLDGLTSATNTQPSWIGDGFSYQPGFIERRYDSCIDDGQANRSDECWANDNAVLTLPAGGGELIRDASNPDLWHPVHDGGSKVERLRDTSLANGDADGEYWRVTTSDGTRYFFGLNRLPGWTSGKDETASVATVPVFGDDAGEPCNQSTFSASYCAQAYRWNLDYVVDIHGNTMSFWYGQETNNYAREHVTTAVANYTRSSQLVRISYGTDNRTANTDTVYSGTPAARVLFTTVDRCAQSTGCATHDAAHWPDVPWDLDCGGGTCPAGPGPSYWTTKRLSSVTTQVATGPGTFKDVESYTLGVSWLDPGIGDQSRIMWLNSVVHTGLNGAAPDVALPAVTFGPTGTSMYNRVNATDGNGLFKRFRLATITNEYGGVLGVTYSAPDCVTGTRMPAGPESNVYRCFPVYWTPPGGSQLLDYFHKYVVTSVTETDGGAGSATTATSYTYPTDGAFWHYDAGPTTPTARRTWSQWRGYEQVTVTTGAAGTTQSRRVAKYFRGRNGDRLPTGTRSQTYTVNGTVYPDDDWLAGTMYQSTVSNGVGGAVVKEVSTEPWVSGPTASRTIDGVTTSAYAVNVARQTTRTPRDGGRADLVTAVSTTYSDGSDSTPRGRPLTIDNQGDTSTTADDSCVRTTYAGNGAAYLFQLPSEVETDGVRCSVTPTSADQVLSIVRTWYDDGTSFPTLPSKGDVTKIEQLSAWNANPAGRTWATTERHSYDPYGRVRDSFDALDRKSSIAYTPATGGPVTGLTNTNPLLWTTTTVVEPAWGLATRTTDVNGQVTDLTYDALGRSTAVWLPGWSKSAHPTLASRAFTTTVRNSGGLTSVATSVLNPAGTGYLTSYELIDGMARTRQTQSTAATGTGRVITDTFYDSRGHVVKTNAAYYDTGAAGTTLFPILDSAVPAQTRTTYDGADRVVTEALFTQNVEKWHTTTGYGGDRIDTTPPAGGTPTSSITDSGGRTVELRHYHGSTATPFTAGSFDATTFQYDHSGRRIGMTDARGSHWSWSFDQLGRTIGTTDPDRGSVSSTYDNADQLLSVTDARASTLSYAYDSLGRRTSLWQGAVGTGAKLSEWTFDTLQKGRVTSATRFVGGASYTTTTTGYDGAGRATGTSVTIPTSETGLGGTYSFGVTYNPDGSIATTTAPGIGGLPAETLTHGYTSTGRPSTLTGASTYVSDTTYLETGEVTSIMDGNEEALTSNDYDPVTKRMVHLNVQAVTSPDILAETGFSYDPAGNLTKVANRLAQYGPSYGPDDTQCYQYDYLRRTSQAWTPSTGDCTATPSTAALGGAAPYWLSWSYDLVGDRTSQVNHTAAGNQTTNYAYPSATAARPHAVTSTTGAVSGTYGYDAAGNTTSRPGPGGQQTLVWDAEGRVTSATVGSTTSSTVYDADGNRLIARDSTGATLYLAGTELRVGPGGTNPTGTRRYSHADRVVATRTGNGGATWLFSDPQDTASVAIRASDQAILRQYQTPFGTARGSAVTWPDRYGYVGGVNDASGLVHLGAREYDAATGRFVSVDPVADVTSPQQMQGYSYANNNPTTLSDPSGLEPGSWCPDGTCSLLVESGIPRDSPIGIYIREIATCDTILRCPAHPPLDEVLKAAKRPPTLPGIEADYTVIEYGYTYTKRISAPKGELNQVDTARTSVINTLSTSQNCLVAPEGLACLNDISGGLNIGTKQKGQGINGTLGKGKGDVDLSKESALEIKVTVNVGIIVSRTGEVYFSVGVVVKSSGASGDESKHTLSIREGKLVTSHPLTPATASELAESIPGSATTYTKYAGGLILSGSRDNSGHFSTEGGYTTQAGVGEEWSVSCTRPLGTPATDCHLPF